MAASSLCSFEGFAEFVQGFVMGIPAEDVPCGEDSGKRPFEDADDREAPKPGEKGEVLPGRELNCPDAFKDDAYRVGAGGLSGSVRGTLPEASGLSVLV